MKNIQIERAIFMALIGVTLTPITVTAQDGNSVEEVIVSAARVDLAPDQVASAVTVITADDIAMTGVTELADVLRSVPGISIARGGPAGNLTQIRMRGAEANQTLVLLDGVRLNDPAFGDEVQLEHIALTDIERIEIVRGPQSAVWGTDAVAGVINIITKRGGVGDVRVNAFAKGGDFGRYTFGGDVRAGGDDGWFGAYATHLSQDGSNASRVGTEKDGYLNTTAGVKGGVKLESGLELSAALRYEDTRSEFDATDFFVTGLPADSDDVTYTEKWYVNGEARFQHGGGQFRHKLSLAYTDTNIENLSAGADNGSTYSEAVNLTYDLSLRVTDGHILTAAIDYEDIDFHQRGPVLFFGDPNQDQSLHSTGYMLDYVGEVRGLTVLASVRRDDNSDFKNVTTWRGGVRLPVADAWAFRVTYGKAQKIPTFSERFGFFTGNFIGNPTLRPETSKSLDVGFDLNMPDIGLSGAITYFHTRLEDEINGFVFDVGSGLFTAQNVADTSKRDGFEVALTWQVNGDLGLTGQYSHVMSKQPNGLGGFDPELRRPKDQASFAAHFTPKDRWSGYFGLDYVGKALDVFFPVAGPSETVVLNDYVLGRINVSYQVSDMLRLALNVENLFDSDYEDVFGYNTAGRGVFIGLNAAF